MFETTNWLYSRQNPALLRILLMAVHYMKIVAVYSPAIIIQKYICATVKLLQI